MSIVKELNELAEKMTGENPKNKTIGKALDYIEQNYSTGGGGSGETTDVYYINYEIEYNRSTNTYTATCDKTYSQLNEEINEFFDEHYPNIHIRTKITENGETRVASHESGITTDSATPTPDSFFIMSADINFHVVPSPDGIGFKAGGVYIKHKQDDTIEISSVGLDLGNLT